MVTFGYALTPDSDRFTTESLRGLTEIVYRLSQVSLTFHCLKTWSWSRELGFIIYRKNCSTKNLERINWSPMPFLKFLNTLQQKVTKQGKRSRSSFDRADRNVKRQVNWESYCFYCQSWLWNTKLNNAIIRKFMKRVESQKSRVHFISFHFIYFDYACQIIRKCHIFNSINGYTKQNLQLLVIMKTTTFLVF